MTQVSHDVCSDAAAESRSGQTVFSPVSLLHRTESSAQVTHQSGATEPLLMEVEGLEDEGPSHTEDVQAVQQQAVQQEQSVQQQAVQQQAVQQQQSVQQQQVEQAAQDRAERVLVDKKAVDKLTEGFLSHYLPDLQSSKQALQELTQNQLILLETLDQEVTKFRECNALLDLNSLFTEAKVYHNKLVNIRKEMIMLHEKTTKLKKRALKLQQQKQKEALEKEQQREKELERERQLIAKPAKRA